jgi:hypothetical protein
MRSLKNYAMLGKVFLTGKGFRETCAYCCERQSHSSVLDAEGVRWHNQEVMAEDFERQHQLMAEKEKPVFHSVLTFPPGEQVEDARLVEIGRKYMEKIGMVDTQYAFIKHMDKAHLHVHVIANRVNNHGQPIGKGLIIERSIKAAKELTREYGLAPDEGKRLVVTRREALHEPDAKRYQIYEAISEVLPRCRGLDDLEKELLRKGVTMRYRRDKETGERQGVSFRFGNRSFKGSRVDNGYSLKGLERKLALQEVEREKVSQQLKKGIGLLLADKELRQGMKDREIAEEQEKLRQQKKLEQEQQRLEQEQQLQQKQGQGRGYRPGW